MPGPAPRAHGADGVRETEQEAEPRRGVQDCRRLPHLQRGSVATPPAAVKVEVEDRPAETTQLKKGDKTLY